MAVKISYLISDIIILLLQIAVITSSGFILFSFSKKKSIHRNPSRQLVLFLAATDFIYALAILPHAIYLVRSWNPLSLDLSAYYIVISSTPLIVQLKIHTTLTISIALERALALTFPLAFRKLSYYSYARLCLLTRFLLRAFDLILDFFLSPIKIVPSCAAIGGFLSNKFRHYWRISNMVMGTMVIVLMSLILVKLRALQKQKTSVKVVVNSSGNKFKQANRTCKGILFTSLVFVTMPSMGVSVVEMVGFSVFIAVGPFYTVAMLCAGACKSIVYFALNKDMRALGLQNLCRKGHVPGNPIRTITASTA